MASNIQRNIKHVVVLMMENRSLDNLLGWLYEPNDQNINFNPPDSPKSYNGLSGSNYSNPLDLNDPNSAIAATKGVDNFRVPNPDPNEAFKDMNQQLFGLEIDKNTKGWLPKNNDQKPKPNMRGFLYDYSTAKCSSAKIAPQIMGSYTNEDLSMMSGLAKAYAVSDNYHASCPTQTWPNRAFMHAGTSLGNVNNAPYIPYDVTTIYNAFEDYGHSWGVYKASEIIPSLTRIQMVKLWDPLLDDHFHHISKFIDDCKTGNLPDYSFLEPTFVVEKGAAATSEHPPANVCAGDHYLQKIWQAISTSPAFNETLFIINFDEHGGCPDHVPPNWTAKSPDNHSNPGKLDFDFNRYGVRVPCIFVSPHIKQSTVFRASDDPWCETSVPYDHTSILAMLLDWKGIPRNTMSSQRIDEQPINPFDELISDDCRTDVPTLSATCNFTPPSLWERIKDFFGSIFGCCTSSGSPTSLQHSIVAANAYFNFSKSPQKLSTDEQQLRVKQLLANIKKEKHIVKHFQR